MDRFRRINGRLRREKEMNVKVPDASDTVARELVRSFDPLGYVELAGETVTDPSSRQLHCEPCGDGG